MLQGRPRPLLHLAVFGALFGLATTYPPTAAWPWLWLVPLITYACVVASIPALARSFISTKRGEITARHAMALGIAAALTSGTLVLYQLAVCPSPGPPIAAFPALLPGHQLVFLLLFPVVNACCEELVFRGLVYDAAEAVNGQRFAIVASGVLFGVAHLHGYPHGATGMILATLFGVFLGILRMGTGGLLAPVLIHIVADTAIAVILLSQVNTP